MEEITLSEEVLQTIDKRLYEERLLEKHLHSQFINLWEKVIQKGISEEENKKILKKHGIPKNCTFTDPPKLNPEVKATFSSQSSSSPIITRDARIVLKQETLNACLAAVSKILTTIIDEKRDKENITVIDCANDLIMLLADLHRDESMIRRSLVISKVTSSFKEILLETQCQDFLFGAKLDELIKTKKALENSTKSFQNHSKSQAYKSKNFNGPPSKKNQKSSGWRGQSSSQGHKKTQCRQHPQGWKGRDQQKNRSRRQ